MKHYSVLTKEIINSLKIKKDGIYVDATLGLGGHTSKIAELAYEGKVISFDQDPIALEQAKKNLSTYKNIIFINDNFSNLEKNLKKIGIKKVDGVLYDLGTSYYQLTDEKRGFTYHGKTKLDMRMNPQSNFSALNVINEYSEEELKNIFYKYGDEKKAPQLAKEIVKARSENKIIFNEQLNEIIKSVKGYDKNKHPSKNIYQAIRIEVNDEINVIGKSLMQSSKVISIGSSIVVITFHSLEDKETKNTFFKLKELQSISEMGNIKYFKTHKTIYPTKEEIILNNPSRSAKLRSITKIEEYE